MLEFTDSSANPAITALTVVLVLNFLIAYAMVMRQSVKVVARCDTFIYQIHILEK